MFALSKRFAQSDRRAGGDSGDNPDSSLPQQVGGVTPSNQPGNIDTPASGVSAPAQPAGVQQPSQQQNYIPAYMLKQGDVAVLYVGDITRRVVVVDYITESGKIRGWAGRGKNLQEAVDSAKQRFMKWTLFPSNPAFKSKDTTLNVMSIPKALVLENLQSQFPVDYITNIAPGFSLPTKQPVPSSNPEIREAIAQSRLLECDYTRATDPGAGTVTHRILECLYVFYAQETGLETLLAIDRQRNAFRFFRVMNINNAKISRKYRVDINKRLKNVNRTLEKMEKSGNTKSLMFEMLSKYKDILLYKLEKHKSKRRKSRKKEEEGEKKSQEGKGKD